MEFADARKTEDAIVAVALTGGAAAMGVIALCAELVRAGLLSRPAADRVRDAMLVEISGTPAPEHGKGKLSVEIWKEWERRLPSEP